MDSHWFNAAVKAGRPVAVAALTRWFGDLDQAEEFFQEACLRAWKSWPKTGAPADPAAWLARVGRNAGVDALRHQARFQPLSEEARRRLADPSPVAPETLDRREYGDDLLRLMFTCCHPALSKTSQIALTLKVISGLTVAEIARAFLSRPKSMEKRLTRAKQTLATAAVSFDPPGREERARRLGAVATVVYLIFNEGYGASGGEAHIRLPFCEEAIRLARLLLRLFPGEAELMGLLALCLLQHARRPARLDAGGDIVLLEDQDRGLWLRPLIGEGLGLLEKALRKRRPGPFQIQAAIAAVHDRADRAEDTDWREIERLYRALEQCQPSPVVVLNRAVAVAKTSGAAPALALIEPLEPALGGYFHFHGVRGALLAELERYDDALTSLAAAKDLARSRAESEHIRRQIAFFSKKMKTRVGSGPSNSSSD